MASYNKIQLTGKVDSEPTVKVTTNGHSVSSFTLIVPRLESLPNERFDYIRVTAWRDNADKAAQFKKGEVLFVEGRILVNSFEDSDTGKRKWVTEVEAKQLVSFTDVFKLSTAESNGSSGSFNEQADSISTDTIDAGFVSESSFFGTQESNSNEKTLEEDVPF